MRSDCPGAPQLQGLLDGTLNDQDAASVAEHLDECEKCRKAVANESVMGGSLVDMLQGVSPDGAKVGSITTMPANYRDIARVALEETEGFAGHPARPIRKDETPDRLGNFRIIRQIGRGGMGVVFEAEQMALGRIVALKILPSEMFRRRNAVERFQREAASAASLHHTNIVPVFEVGEADGTWFYAMQLINGAGLDVVRNEIKRFRSRHGWETDKGQSTVAEDRQRKTNRAAKSEKERSAQSADKDEAKASLDVVEVLSNLAGSKASTDDAALATQADSKLPAEDEGAPEGLQKSQAAFSSSHFRSVAEIGRQAASALQHAHQRGIIHRDVKPSNLLLDHEGIVWLTDFGLAKQNDDGLTGAGEAPGTLRYMAPERFKGESTPASDIYALGVTLYELLTLGPVFSSTDHVSLIQQIRDYEPTAPKRLDNSVPFDLQTIIQKAMAKDPARRYGSAKAMEEDLAAFLDGQPISARRVGNLERLWLWSKKHKALATCLAAVALLVITIACGSSWAAYHFNEQKNHQAKLSSANFKLAQEKSAESATAARQRDAAYLNAYFADMRQAHQDWKNGQMRRLLATLKRYLPDYPGQDVRGWEWYYLLSLAHQDRKTLLDHEGLVTQVAWSPDGSRLISLSADTLMVWDEEGTLLKKINAPGVRQFAFNADGKQFATVSGDALVRIWNIKQAKQGQLKQSKVEQAKVEQAQVELDRTIETAFPLAAIDWSRQGDRIAVTRLSRREPGLLILNAKTGDTISSKTLSFHAPISSLKFSPDGQYLGVVFLGKYFDVFDTQEERYLYSKKFNTIPQFKDFQAMCFAWNKDSRRFAVGSFQQGARLYELKTDEPFPKQLAILQDDTSVDAIGFTAEGDQLLVGNRAQRVDCFDLKTKSRKNSLKGHLSALRTVAHHPTRDLIATGANDGAVKLWSLTETAAAEAQDNGFDEVLSSGAFADGRFRWKQAGKDILISDDAGKQLAQIPGVGPVTHSQYFSKSKRLLLAYRHGSAYTYGLDRLWVINTEDWTQQPLRGVPAGYPSAMQKGEFAAVSTKGFVFVFDGRQGTTRRFRPHTQGCAVDLSPDGAMLATCSYGEVAVWDTATGAELGRYFGHRPMGFMPTIHWGNQGNLLATGSIDQTVKIWDVKQGKCLQTLQGLQGTPLYHYFGFSHDDSRFMAAGPQHLKVWDVQSGRELLSFELAAFETNLHSLFRRFRTISTDVGFSLRPSVLRFESLALAESLRDNRKGVEQFQHHAAHELARELLLHSPDEQSQQRGLQLAQRALEQDPTNAGYLMTAGLAQYLHGQDAAALKAFSLAKSSGLKGSPELHFLMAACFRRSGKDDAMQKALKTAGELAKSSESLDPELLPLINQIAAECVVESSKEKGAEHIIVNSLEDVVDGTSDGKISLREAILLVKDGGRITIDTPGVIEVKLGVMKIDKSLSLEGPGSSQLAIDGRERSRLLAIENGVSGNQTTVHLKGLTLKRGFAAGGPTGGPSSETWKEARGGCIFCSETLVISDCVLEESVLPKGVGGAIYVNQYADVTLKRCSIRANSSAGGGAFYVGGGSKLRIDSCTFAENSTVGLGGAIRLMGVMTMVNSTLSANAAPTGGAIAMSDSAAGTSIDHCTFANNSGAAIQLYSRPSSQAASELKITNSLFVGNKVHGGAEDLDIGTLGGVIPSLQYSLFAKVDGKFNDLGNNQMGVDAKLEPLQLNGGPTRTHKIAPDSPAVDAAAPKTPEAKTHDQRGQPFARSVDGDGKDGALADIGAFELQRN